jgi:hypothetical protein
VSRLLAFSSKLGGAFGVPSEFEAGDAAVVAEHDAKAPAPTTTLDTSAAVGPRELPLLMAIPSGKFHCCCGVCVDATAADRRPLTAPAAFDPVPPRRVLDGREASVVAAEQGREGNQRRIRRLVLASGRCQVKPNPDEE